MTEEKNKRSQKKKTKPGKAEIENAARKKKIGHNEEKSEITQERKDQKGPIDD